VILETSKKRAHSCASSTKTDNETMTLTHTQNTKKSGMTLIELTVVILVLLSLISILFVGATAWKRGSDRAGCIMNIRNVQQGMRSFQNMNGHSAGDNVTGAQTEIVGTGKFVETPPSCPASGTYTIGGNALPGVGSLYMTCSLAVQDGHEPSRFSDW
jgi:prepilin-type N-terminal cleavage/methylation domain-containing protein